MKLKYELPHSKLLTPHSVWELNATRHINRVFANNSSYAPSIKNE